MAYEYQPEILTQLLEHGVRPTARTRPALVFSFLNDLYRHELRRLKQRRAAKHIAPQEYAAHVVALRRRYPLVSVPVRFWTVAGTPGDPEDGRTSDLCPVVLMPRSADTINNSPLWPLKHHR
jgi:hypothetical protein